MNLLRRLKGKDALEVLSQAGIASIGGRLKCSPGRARARDFRRYAASWCANRLQHTAYRLVGQASLPSNLEGHDQRLGRSGRLPTGEEMEVPPGSRERYFAGPVRPGGVCSGSLAQPCGSWGGRTRLWKITPLVHNSSCLHCFGQKSFQKLAGGPASFGICSGKLENMPNFRQFWPNRESFRPSLGKAWTDFGKVWPNWPIWSIWDQCGPSSDNSGPISHQFGPCSAV